MLILLHWQGVPRWFAVAHIRRIDPRAATSAAPVTGSWIYQGNGDEGLTCVDEPPEVVAGLMEAGPAMDTRHV